MSNKKHERMCTGCGQMKERSELIRIIKTNEDEIFIDMTGKSNGRGAYICKDAECLKKAISRKGLERAFKCKIPEDTFRMLDEEISKI